MKALRWRAATRLRKRFANASGKETSSRWDAVKLSCRFKAVGGTAQSAAITTTIRPRTKLAAISLRMRSPAWAARAVLAAARKRR